MSKRLSLIVALGLILATVVAVAASSSRSFAATAKQTGPCPPAMPSTSRTDIAGKSVSLVEGTTKLAKYASSDGASPTFRFGRICIEAGVTIDRSDVVDCADPSHPVCYTEVYLIYVESGKLRVTVEVPSGGRADTYAAGTAAQPAATSLAPTPSTISMDLGPGQLFFIENANVKFENVAGNGVPTYIITSGVLPGGSMPPMCTQNCWLP